MRQSEYFRYGRSVKLHGFQKYSNEGKKSNSYILLIMSHNPAHQDAPTSQGTQPTPTVPPIALVYAFRYVLSTI